MHMNETYEKHSRETSQQVTRWTRQYAQSRAFPVLVGLAVMGSIAGVIMVASMGGGWAWRAGHYFLFCFCLAMAITAVGLNIWFSVPPWGGRWLHRFAWRYYDREGRVNITCNALPKQTKWIAWGVVFLFVSSILTHVILGVGGYISDEMMQPVSALYVVPFSVFIALASRTYLYLLFPTLYSLHAALLLTGVPLRLWSNQGSDMMILPMYMAFTAIVMHLYNRYALTRLKRAVRTIDVGESK